MTLCIVAPKLKRKRLDSQESEDSSSQQTSTAETVHWNDISMYLPLTSGQTVDTTTDLWCFVLSVHGWIVSWLVIHTCR